MFPGPLLRRSHNERCQPCTLATQIQYNAPLVMHTANLTPIRIPRSDLELAPSNPIVVPRDGEIVIISAVVHHQFDPYDAGGRKMWFLRLAAQSPLSWRTTQKGSLALQ